MRLRKEEVQRWNTAHHLTYNWSWAIYKSSRPLLNTTFPHNEPTFTRVNKTHIRKASAHISHIFSVPTDKNTPKVSWNARPRRAGWQRAELSQHFLRNLQTQRKSKGHNNVTTIADANYISVKFKASDFSYVDSSGFKNGSIKVQRRGNVCKPVTAANTVL